MDARPVRIAFALVAFTWLLAGCRSGSDAAEPRPCPRGAGTCLAWDGFDGSGVVDEDGLGQAWKTWAMSCGACEGPELDADEGRARIEPSNGTIQVWGATVDTGRATGVRVSADITTSPTPLRANVGLIALFEDPENHLDCKIEVSEGHPDGLVAIGDELADRTTSLLASAEDMGLRNGTTYHVELTIPGSLDADPVECRVTGGGIEPTTISYRLTPERIEAYGDGTGQGLRIKIFDDEDDGSSSWDDFEVRPLT